MGHGGDDNNILAGFRHRRVSIRFCGTRVFRPVHFLDEIPQTFDTQLDNTPRISERRAIGTGEIGNFGFASGVDQLCFQASCNAPWELNQ